MEHEPAPKLGDVRVTQVVLLVLRARSGSWRAAEAWHCEYPGEAIDEGATSVAVDGPRLKGSGKGAEAWHHERSL